MLKKWEDRLKKEGVKMSLEFVSVDETLQEMLFFLKTNPIVAKSAYVKNPDDLAPWVVELGLDSGAGLPFHIFVDSKGSILCVRAGAIGEDHYSIIQKLLR